MKCLVMWICALVIVTLSAVQIHGQSDNNYVYEVIVDAGTSGCEPKVFRWERNEDLPQIESLLDEKVRPGLQEFAENLSDLSAYLGEILQFAKDHVPQAHHAVTPITFLATAGILFSYYSIFDKPV